MSSETPWPVENHFELSSCRIFTWVGWVYMKSESPMRFTRYPPI